MLAENTSCSLGELIHQRFLVLGEFDLSPIAREPIHDRIIQVFMNLISNALDALVDLKSHPDLIEQRDHLIPKDSPRTEHSNVQTDMEITWQPLIMITSAITEIDNRNWVSGKIADNGMGIPKEIQNRIFDNFFTTKG